MREERGGGREGNMRAFEHKRRRVPQRGTIRGRGGGEGSICERVRGGKEGCHAKNVGVEDAECVDRDAEALEGAEEFQTPKNVLVKGAVVAGALPWEDRHPDQ